MLIGAGVLVAIYLVFKRKTVLSVSVNDATPEKEPTKQSLSDKDKNTLFNATLEYRGGAVPTQGILNELREKSTEALAKVKALGLEAELSAWTKANYSRVIPMTMTMGNQSMCQKI